MSHTYRLYATIEFNRPLNDQEIILPGGYRINTDFGDYTFDFTECESNRTENVNCIDIMCKNPDYDYEDTARLTPTDFKRIISFEDFCIDLEGCAPDLKIVAIKDIVIQFIFNKAINNIVIPEYIKAVENIVIPDYIIEDYCEKNIAA